MAFVDAKDGLKAVYRKVHLWASELQWADPGEGFSTFEAGPVRMGMWICYDTRFPEAARSLAMGGATAALVGAAWVGPADEWELVLRARAIDNGMFVAGTVLQGENDGLCFHGTGIIVDPHGRVLARAAEGSDEVILGEYDPGVIRAFRDRLPLLEHRRPAAYRQS
jgi:predicted amidohydrolase